MHLSCDGAQTVYIIGCLIVVTLPRLRFGTVRSHCCVRCGRARLCNPTSWIFMIKHIGFEYASGGAAARCATNSINKVKS